MIINYYYLTLFSIFSILSYMIIVDKNIADYIILVLKLIKINFERYIWMIRLHPKNPITNYLNSKKYLKIARELEKELSKTPLD